MRHVTLRNIGIKNFPEVVLEPIIVKDGIKYEDEKDLTEFFRRDEYYSENKNFKYAFKCLRCGNKWEDYYTPSLCLNCDSGEIWSFPGDLFKSCNECGMMKHGDPGFGWSCPKCKSIQVVSNDFEEWE